MAYLSSIGLERYRTFGSFRSFRFAPLTIIVGPNSSGKSSLLKMLMLLKENAVAGGFDRLSFRGGEHGLGSFQSTLSYRHTGPLGVTLGFSDTLKSGIPIGPIYLNPKEDVPAQSRDVPYQHADEAHITFNWEEGFLRSLRITFGDHVGDRPLFTMRRESTTTMLNGPDDEPFETPSSATFFEIDGRWFYRALGGSDEAVSEALGLELDSVAFRFLRYLDGTLELACWDGDTNLSQIEHSIAWGSQIGYSEARLDPPLEQIVRNFLFFTVGGSIRRLLDDVAAALSVLEFNGTFRDTPRRVFARDNINRDFADLLDDFARSGYVVRSVSTWLSRFGMGTALEVKEIEEQSYTVHLLRDEHPVSIADIGHGHAQLIPLILHLGLQKRRTTMLLEEPEAGLHPNLQSRLADLFVDLIGTVDEWPPEYKRNMWVPRENKKDLPPLTVLTKRLIVETHSEYLIRRLQYLVAAGKADPDRIVIYYLGLDPDAEDYVKQIRIAASGRLSDEFGSGFLDEASNLMIDLYKYGSQN